MKIRIILGVCTGTLMMGTVAALGADPLAPPPPPPIEVYPEVSSCIYVRGDVGIATYERPDFVKNLPGGAISTALGEEMKDTLVADIGIGCQYTENLRADVTLGYRSKSRVEDDFNSLDAKFSATTLLVNAYYDIGNFNGFTPYIGAGIGISRNKLSDVRLPAGSTSGTKTSFAYALHAGVSYDFTEALSVDASYRYIDLGKGKSGPDVIDIDKLVGHDFRIGLRYRFID